MAANPDTAPLRALMAMLQNTAAVRAAGPIRLRSRMLPELRNEPLDLIRDCRRLLRIALMHQTRYGTPKLLQKYH